MLDDFPLTSGPQVQWISLKLRRLSLNVLSFSGSIHLLHSPMFDPGSKQMHRRMTKVKRSPKDAVSYSYSATQTPALAQTTATTNTQSPPSLPPRTAALAGVIAFLALALILCEF